MPEADAMFSIDAFNGVPLALFGVLWAACLAMCPRQDFRRQLSNYLLVLVGTVIAYCANHLLMFWLGWTISAAPLLFDRSLRASSRITLLGGCLSLGGGLLLLSRAEYGEWAFALITLAVIQRKGLFPLHGWVAESFEKGDLLVASLIFNAHLGVVAVARIALRHLPDVSRSALTILAELALVTAVVAALAALGERRPRRQLALISISQASLILAGLEGVNQAAITGALVHWMVVSLAATGLVAVLRLIEVRETSDLTSAQNLGLAGRFPRLAVFFLLSGMALVGLPGTLGFASEDLLIHGALDAHPWIGLATPLATALNAISLFRLFSRLFLGSRREPSTVTPDATFGERLPLTAIALALIGLGVFPQVAVRLRESAAQSLQQIEGAQSAPAAAPHAAAGE